jgi:hypothetical protein
MPPRPRGLGEEAPVSNEASRTDARTPPGLASWGPPERTTPVNDTATTQTLTHLTNITGFLREIVAELKAINRRETAKEARRHAEKTARKGPTSR